MSRRDWMRFVLTLGATAAAWACFVAIDEILILELVERVDGDLLHPVRHVRRWASIAGALALVAIGARTGLVIGGIALGGCLALFGSFGLAAPGAILYAIGRGAIIPALWLVAARSGEGAQRDALLALLFGGVAVGAWAGVELATPWWGLAVVLACAALAFVARGQTSVEPAFEGPSPWWMVGVAFALDVVSETVPYDLQPYAAFVQEWTIGVVIVAVVAAWWLWRGPDPRVRLLLAAVATALLPLGNVAVVVSAPITAAVGYSLCLANRSGRPATAVFAAYFILKRLLLIAIT